MKSTETTERSKLPKTQAIIVLLILAISIVAAGWIMVTVSTTSQIPPSDFVTLPTDPLSTTGGKVRFVSVSAIGQNTVAVGVKGYLTTISGAPVAGAKVYMTYYLQGAYRTQVATTDQNGHFEARFPMNWTGWLPLTLTYFGDEQHQGLTHVFSVSGQNLATVQGFYL
jgi:hypothetical protein